jgi:protocatechuate 3,4-dioxygenase beta subunit
MTAVDKKTHLSQSNDPLRRKLLSAIGGLSLMPHLAWAEKLLPTPRQTTGPFYPEELPLDDDNDLTRVAGRPGMASGQITDLTGRVLDTNGRPIGGVRVEIWQCDANGLYHHPRDRRSRDRDENFQGHGHTVSDETGNYRFRTIRPVPYPGRTPHIHAMVLPAGTDPLVTQIYVTDEPGNARDFLFRSVPEERRSLVAAEFKPDPRGTTDLVAQFDFVVGVTPGQA